MLSLVRVEVLLMGRIKLAMSDLFMGFALRGFRVYRQAFNSLQPQTLSPKSIVLTLRTQA